MPRVRGFLFPIDGACQRVQAGETAFTYRSANFWAVIAGAWPASADNEANIRWVTDYHEALRPHSEEGVYVNFISEDDAERLRANYGPNLDRLVEAKTKYDPTNLFRRNHNIPPRAA